MTSKQPNQSDQPMTSKWMVAFVEDQRDIRERWVRLLESFDDFRCLGTCSSGEEALRVIPAISPLPDVVLMDIFPATHVGDRMHRAAQGGASASPDSHPDGFRR